MSGRITAATKISRLLMVIGSGALACAVPACVQEAGPDEVSAGNEDALSVTATFQNGAFPSAAYAGTTDVLLQEATPTTTAGEGLSLQADRDAPAGTAQSVESILRFDLSSIPVGSPVTSASLTVNVTNPTGGAGYNLYALNKAWTESQATWSAATSGSAWAAPGARGATDRGAAVLGTLLPAVAGKSTITLTAAGIAAVQSWIDQPSKNFGFVVDAVNNMDGLAFDSSEASVVANRPALAVAYTDPGTTAPTGYGAGTAPIGTPCVNPTVTVNATMTTAQIQSAISGAGNGAYICFASGTYRLTTQLQAAAGQTLHGSPNTVIKGSALLTGATASGSNFVYSSVPLVYAGPTEGNKKWCEDTVNFPCAFAEDVFFDGKPLTRATTLAGVNATSFYTDYAAKKVYLGANPSGHTVEIGRTKFAFLIGNDNVTLEGFIVEMFAHPMDSGAIAFGSGTGGMVRNNEVRYNHGNGAVGWATSTTFQYNRFHDNGQTGVSSSNGAGVVVDHNDVIHNNIFGFMRNDGASGGIKIDLENLSTVTNNYVKDNLSFGIYHDENADNGLIEHNYVEGNWAAGIEFVFSRNGKIFNNISLNNGLDYHKGRKGEACTATQLSCMAGGIYLANASGTEVRGNTVTGNALGIVLVEFVRDQASVSWTVPHTSNNSIHDNIITVGEHATGARQYIPSPSSYNITTSNNVFTNNTYHLVSLTGAYFDWNGLKTRDQWKASGQDTTGTFLTP